jgi:uncharacterized protein
VFVSASARAYAHYGESAGEPRQLESPAEKLSDLRAAVSYLSRLPYVQAVGMVGVCTSGGNAAYLGAVEPRVKALATVAAYSEVDQPAVNHGSVGSYDYYLNEARGNVPEYRNESALMGLAGFLEFDPVGTASAVTTPTMVVHSDGCAFPAAAKKFYSELRGQKELVWADGTHYDYYDSQPQIDNAVANVTRFFRTHLAEDGA